MEKNITVDVVIPTYRPDDKFRKLMESLQRQTYPIDHIVIMNTEEEYFPKDILVGTTNVEVHHIKKEDFDHGGTRNLGAGYCNGDIIVFMTQDAVPKDAYLIERLIQPIQKDLEERKENIVAVYARQLPCEDGSFTERYTRTFNYPAIDQIKSKEDIPILGIKTFFCSNVCAAYRRDIYLELGGFVRQAIFNEDMIFAGNAVQEGYSIAYQSKAKVIHSHNYTSTEQFHRNFDLAVSQKDHPEIFGGIRSESEGIRLVRKTGNYLIQNGKWFLIPDLIIKSGFKYMGYFLGKRYDRLPKKFTIWCSMNRSYWGRKSNV